MKRIILLIILTLISVGFESVTSFAEVKTEKNSFDGTVTTTSAITNVEPWSLIVFMKGGDNYFFSIGRVETEWWFFDNNIEFKIDGVITSLKAVKTSSDFIPVRRMYSSSTVVIVTKIVDKIKAAKSIDIRVNFTKHSPIVWSVPISVLNEWKEVIGNEDSLTKKGV